MSWLTLDDRIVDHPKFVRASLLAGSTPIHLWIAMVAYCKQQLSDGRVPADMLSRLSGPAPRWRKRALDALITVGLVERAGGELILHDWLDWNESRDEVERRGGGAPGRKRRPPPRSVRKKKQGVAGTLSIVGPVVPSVVRASSERRPSVVGASCERRSVSNDNGALSEVGLARARAKSNPIHLPPYIPPRSESERTDGEPKTGGLKNNPSRGKTAIASDFAPAASVLSLATELGFTEALERTTRAEFVDYWRGTGRMMKDWQAVYRNRLRAVAERRGLKPAKRDERWRAHQAALARARQAPERAAPVPAGFDQKLGGLFG